MSWTGEEDGDGLYDIAGFTIKFLKSFMKTIVLMGY